MLWRELSAYERFQQVGRTQAGNDSVRVLHPRRPGFDLAPEVVHPIRPLVHILCLGESPVGRFNSFVKLGPFGQDVGLQTEVLERFLPVNGSVHPGEGLLEQHLIVEGIAYILERSSPVIGLRRPLFGLLPEEGRRVYGDLERNADLIPVKNRRGGTVCEVVEGERQSLSLGGL